MTLQHRVLLGQLALLDLPVRGELSAGRLQKNKLSQPLSVKYLLGLSLAARGRRRNMRRRTHKIHPIFQQGGFLVNLQTDVKNSISNLIKFRQTPDSLPAGTCLVASRVHAPSGAGSGENGSWSDGAAGQWRRGVESGSQSRWLMRISPAPFLLLASLLTLH